MRKPLEGFARILATINLLVDYRWRTAHRVDATPGMYELFATRERRWGFYEIT